MPDIDYFADLHTNVQQALAEDIGTGDLSADFLPETANAQAWVLLKQDAVVCGRPWFDEVMRQVDSAIHVTWHCHEGDALPSGSRVCEITGPATAILSAERSALNFLQTLSGTATVTQHYVEALKGFGTHLLDTRKTLPGLRLAQKYAVHCGGGTNHRVGLYDAILLKENHLMAAGGLLQAVKMARQKHPGKTLEVETETLTEVEQALQAGADIIMLDNFTLSNIRTAVKMVNRKAKLEVSGNVELAHLVELADTGVDFISTGAITKHLQAIDYSMRFHLETD
ncbi:MAG: carboxylating nicotinate-nucleotide diphosphorylase [Hydrogenovibrio sp.]